MNKSVDKKFVVLSIIIKIKKITRVAFILNSKILNIKFVKALLFI